MPRTFPGLARASRLRLQRGLARLRGAVERYPSTVCCVALALAGLLLFGRTIFHDFTLWDDDIYVTRNPLIRDFTPSGVARVFTTFSNCNYHPLTYLSYMAEYALVGLSPWLYHLDNVLLHVLASILAFQLCRRWLDSSAPALLAALLFLAHPLRVESVAWVAERKDVLSAAFYLAALLVYPRAIRSGSSKRYALSLSLFLLALLSKVMAITLPLALLAVLVFERRATRREVLALLPFLALAALFCLLGIAAQSADGAVKGLHGGSLWSHILTVPKALAFYAKKLALPLDLSPRYLLAPASGLLDPWVLAGLGLAAAGIVAAARSFRGDRKVFLGLSIFALAWAPVSGIVPSSTLVADRYVYLPALGVFVVLGALAAREIGGAPSPSSPPAPPRPALLRSAASRWVLFAALLLLAGSFYLTPARASVWRDGMTLWTDVLTKEPRNPYAYNQISHHHAAAGQFREAAEATIRAAELGLTAPKFMINLCFAYRELGERERELESARGILAGAPDFLPAWYVVLRRLLESGRLDDCEKLLDDLSTRFPADAGLLAARGLLEESRGNLPRALFHLLNSIELVPGNPEVRLAASVVLASLGDGERALRLAEETARSDQFRLLAGPKSQLQRLAAVFERAGKSDAVERVDRLLAPAGAGR